MLLFMTCFVMHDYITGQGDAVAKIVSVQPYSQQLNLHTAAVEHQAFHMLALGELIMQPQYFPADLKLHFSYSMNLADRPASPPFTPPKTV
ncbi:hypothetical protein NNO_0605 [Hydrogenimonas sp.]|nr:hypothetical protein NNO_0605 [Hydrogenimonas sp.]